VLAAALLLAALPALATIWTRSMAVVKVPRGARIPLPNVSYSTRDWSEALTAFEVLEGAAAGEMVSPKWLFHYRNTDSSVHYVAITVQCQDAQRRDRAKFSYTAALAPNVKDEATVEIVSRLRAEDWRETSFARITVDFVSSPGG